MKKFMIKAAPFMGVMLSTVAVLSTIDTASVLFWYEPKTPVELQK